MSRTSPNYTDCRDISHGRLRGVARCFQADVLRYLNKSPENRAAGVNVKSCAGAILTTQLLCLLGHRLAHYLLIRGFRRLAVAMSRLNFYAHKVTIPPEACIGAGCFIPHPVGVTFCGTAGVGLTLYSMAVCSPDERSMEGPLNASPHLGDRVTIGGRAVLLGPIRIGDDTKIFAVCVRQDVEGSTLAVCSRSRQNLRRQRETRDSHDPALA